MSIKMVTLTSCIVKLNLFPSKFQFLSHIARRSQFKWNFFFFLIKIQKENKFLCFTLSRARREKKAKRFSSHSCREETQNKQNEKILRMVKCEHVWVSLSDVCLLTCSIWNIEISLSNMFVFVVSGASLNRF